jgi:hypothetical protein
VLRHRILAVAVAATALLPGTSSYADDHELSAACHFQIAPMVNSNTSTVIITGYAAAPLHLRAVSTAITCSGKVGTTPFSFSNALPGPFAATAGTTTQTIGAVSVCYTATAIWDDLHSKTITNC